jgi:hypothetical protein
MSGYLWDEARRLPQDTLVVAPMEYERPDGVRAWRWITEHDLPGLREQVGPGGRLSHITIDGEIPR